MNRINPISKIYKAEKIEVLMKIGQKYAENLE
jgi:hypothetical protein